MKTFKDILTEEVDESIVRQTASGLSHALHHLRENVVPGLQHIGVQASVKKHRKNSEDVKKMYNKLLKMLLDIAPGWSGHKPL